MHASLATPWEKFKGVIFHCFPHHIISRITYWLTRRRLPFLNKIIGAFIYIFKVDMQDAVIQDISQYPTFNEFFTRKLKPDSRPIDKSMPSIVSPCDGKISMFGEIDQQTLLQAKNKTFTLNEFLTPHCQHINQFRGGSYYTIYLSPRDYHRVHTPYDVQLLEMIYVPGRLYSVAPYAPKTIEKLYARNERVISVFRVDNGYMAIAMVGAVNVAAIDMEWAGTVTPPHMSVASYYNYDDRPINLEKGQQMGTFNMGSTVVMLVSKNYARALPTLAIEQPVKMGETIASRLN